MGYVRAYQEGDVERLAPHLREADRREIQANSGLTNYGALKHSVDTSTILCSIIGNTGEIAGMFGVSPAGPMLGAVWLLGTDELTRPPLSRQFLRECRQWCDGLHSQFPVLFNIIDERNTVHIRWLRWMGFTFIKRHPAHGHEQRPFLEFVRIKPNV